MPKLVPYKDKAGEYRWKRIADNNVDEIAESGEGYVNKDYAITMARKNFPDDPFDWSELPADDPNVVYDDGDDKEDEATAGQVYEKRGGARVSGRRGPPSE